MLICCAAVHEPELAHMQQHGCCAVIGREGLSSRLPSNQCRQHMPDSLRNVPRPLQHDVQHRKRRNCSFLKQPHLLITEGKRWQLCGESQRIAYYQSGTRVGSSQQEHNTKQDALLELLVEFLFTHVASDMQYVGEKLCYGAQSVSRAGPLSRVKMTAGGSKKLGHLVLHNSTPHSLFEHCLIPCLNRTMC